MGRVARRLVLVPVIMAVIMAVIMPAAAGIAMLVFMRMLVGMFMNMQHVALRRRRVRHVTVIMVRMRLVTVALMVAVVVVVVFVAVIMIAVVVTAAAGFAMGVMVIMAIIMRVAMVVAVRLGCLIGAALRLEGRIDHRHAGAQTARHLFQHGIAGDTDAVFQQFGRHMPVAQMPGETGKVVGIARDDLRHRLVRRHHGNRAPVIEREPITLLQAGRLRQVEQEHHVALPAHGDAAAVAAIMRQHHAVGRAGGIPGSGRKKRTGTDHDRVSSGQLLQRWETFAAMPSLRG
ncbi:hypothetical protein QOZ99_003962 [Angulomicrobium amanitiforme]|uniref:Uncharacterized protein n=1 Tax=Ancylobacter amanitiformis TaxID=217069 RepID=A0ABU0LWH0_9HYPH|nr:hypothetical protein [Ancylobacter amanitiformis]